MQARPEQETLISASINIFQQDDINSFPVLPSQTTAKHPLPQPRARERQQSPWHVRFSPSLTYSRLPTFFTRRPAVWRERRRYGCNLTPAGVCWKDLEERESQAFLSSSSLTADLWLRHPDYTQTCQRNSTSIFLELNNAGRSRKSSHSTIGAPSHLWWNFCTQIYIDIHVK